MNWYIEYNNEETRGGGFHSWWEVTDGERCFRTTSEQDAKWLANILQLSVNIKELINKI
jgi:hypothetical protein